MLAAALGNWRTRARDVQPGLVSSLVIAAAATFLADHYKAPVMLFALLIGMAMNFLSADGSCTAGITLASRDILRIGVALLGVRITFEQIAGLGWLPVILVVVAVTLTISLSMLAARMLRYNILFGLLTGGATAICGASAALALSAALPNYPERESAASFTVLCVSTLSTLAMIFYPILARMIGLDDHAAGIFLGGTIHDVAQVVGAGYSISQRAGDTATIVKLLRVSLLLPVIVAAAAIGRAQGGGAVSAKRPPLVPWFAVAFLIIAAINSLGWLPDIVRQGGSELSRWCLVIAISAIGLKTQMKELTSAGFRPVLLMLCETLLIAGIILAGIIYLPAVLS